MLSTRINMAWKWTKLDYKLQKYLMFSCRYQVEGTVAVPGVSSELRAGGCFVPASTQLNRSWDHGTDTVLATAVPEALTVRFHSNWWAMKQTNFSGVHYLPQFRAVPQSPMTQRCGNYFLLCPEKKKIHGLEGWRASVTCHEGRDARSAGMPLEPAPSPPSPQAAFLQAELTSSPRLLPTSLLVLDLGEYAGWHRKGPKCRPSSRP